MAVRASPAVLMQQIFTWGRPGMGVSLAIPKGLQTVIKPTSSGPMKIAIIGAGNVGGALGKSWAKAGHTIFFGVRDPAGGKTKPPLAEIGGGASSLVVP